MHGSTLAQQRRTFNNKIIENIVPLSQCFILGSIRKLCPRSSFPCDVQQCNAIRIIDPSSEILVGKNDNLVSSHSKTFLTQREGMHYSSYSSSSSTTGMYDRVQ